MVGLQDHSHRGFWIADAKTRCFRNHRRSRIIDWHIPILREKTLDSTGMPHRGQPLYGTVTESFTHIGIPSSKLYPNRSTIKVACHLGSAEPLRGRIHRWASFQCLDKGRNCNIEHDRDGRIHCTSYRCTSMPFWSFVRSTGEDRLSYREAAQIMEVYVVVITDLANECLSASSYSPCTP